MATWTTTSTPFDNYTIRLLWRDQRGAQNTGTLAVTVNNVAPTIFAGGNSSIHPESTFARLGFFVDPGIRDNWTATVDFGDGSGIQSLRLNPDHLFLLHHRFDQAGIFQVVVTIRDDDGGISSASFFVTVAGRKFKTSSFLSPEILDACTMVAFSCPVLSSTRGNGLYKIADRMKLGRELITATVQFSSPAGPRCWSLTS